MIAQKVVWTSAISDAMAQGRSVVALESTVIAQGLPWPANLDTARAMEAVVREVGAEPATIAARSRRLAFAQDGSSGTRSHGGGLVAPSPASPSPAGCNS